MVNKIYSVSVVLEKRDERTTQQMLKSWAYTENEVASGDEALGRYIREKAPVKDGWRLVLWQVNTISDLQTKPNENPPEDTGI